MPADTKAEDVEVAATEIPELPKAHVAALLHVTF